MVFTIKIFIGFTGNHGFPYIHWIGLREKLHRKPWFLPSNEKGFPVNFPIIQFYDWYIYKYICVCVIIDS